MKSHIWTMVLYVLAVLIVLGRIGNALDSVNPWLTALKLYLPLNGQMIGADFESLGEDVIVFLAIRHTVIGIQERKARKVTALTPK